MNGRNRELVAHLALAVARYVPEAQRAARQNGRDIPPELLAIAEFLADCARPRQDATLPAPVDLNAEAGLMSEHPVLTKREVAAELRCSARTVERLIESGKLRAVKVEGSTRVLRTDLEAYVASLSPASFRDSVTAKETA